MILTAIKGDDKVHLATGVGPIDERIGGLKRGGTYLLTGGADTAKFVFLMQFLDEGLRNCERVALLSAAPPEDVLEQADYFGFGLGDHWRDGSCSLYGFKAEYPQRVIQATDPNEAFYELQGLTAGLGAVDRIAIDPGSFLWSTRADTTMAQGFVTWAMECGATVAASVAAGLDNMADPSTEWVLQRASGVLHFSRHESGLHEIETRRFTPPAADPGPISLELTATGGLGSPSGKFDRRRDAADRADEIDHIDAADAAADGAEETVEPAPLVFLELGAKAPPELVGLLGRDRETERADDRDALFRRVGGSSVGVVAIYVDRRRADDGIELIRALRPLTAAAVLLLADQELRFEDRAAALDAGADDVFNRGIELRELDARLRSAIESGRREALPAEEPAVHVTGLLDPDAFHELLVERLETDHRDVFSLLRFTQPGIRDLGDILLESVRSQSGDLVAPYGDGFGVLLQDARPQQAEAFLRRVRTELRQRGHAVPLEAEILSSTDAADRIRSTHRPRHEGGIK